MSASALDQRLQAFGELLPLAAAQSHLADELLEAGRAVRLAFDLAEDGGVSDHGKSNHGLPRMSTDS